MRTFRVIPLGISLAFTLQGCGEIADCPTASCGTVVIATGADADVLFPPLASTNTDAAISDLLFLKLADMGLALNTVGDQGFEPRLATSWTREDSLTLAFQIDPDARWHDGIPVTAEDVAFTFDLYTDPVVGAPAGPLLSAIASVAARDSRTAVFRFSERYPEQFFDATHHMRIVPRHIVDSIPRGQLSSHPFVRNPVGSGPYRLVAWAPGETIELNAVDSFFLGAPTIARVIFRITPDATTRIAQIVAGDADLVESVRGPENVARVAAAPSVRLVPYASSTYTFLGFNLRDPNDRSRPHSLFRDRTLRQAIARGMNREVIVRAVLGENGRVPIGPTTPMVAIWADSLRQLPHDSVLALELLNDSGWLDTDGDGVRERDGLRLEFDLLVPTSSAGRRQAAVILQQQLKQLGVGMQIRELEFGTFDARTKAGQYDAAMITFGIDPTPGGMRQFWTRQAIGSGGTNLASYASPTFDSLVVAASRTFDPATARSVWHQAIDVINQDAPGVWLYTATQVAAINQRFENVSIRPDQYTATLWTWRIQPDRMIERDPVDGR